MDAIGRSVLRRLGPGERSRYLSALKRYKSNRKFVGGVYDFVNSPHRLRPDHASYRNAAHAAAAGLLRSNRPLHDSTAAYFLL